VGRSGKRVHLYHNSERCPFEYIRCIHKRCSKDAEMLRLKVDQISLVLGQKGSKMVS
jgi:hypothetical protein